MTQTNIGTDSIIGIDVSKDKLDIMILPSGEYFVIENNRNKIGQFIRKILSKVIVGKIVMEATGGYERLAFEMFLTSEVFLEKVRFYAVRRILRPLQILPGYKSIRNFSFHAFINLY